MGKIALEGMEFFAYHGCYKEEQIIGTRFTVDLEVECDTTLAEHSDHLGDTLNYAELYKLVKSEMMKKSHILENVCRRIVDVVRHTFPEVWSIRLKISKLNPPVGGKMQQVSYSMEWNK
jgi:7,8-dihydroneopterin aldolase/epimerase/oxygenase